MADVKAALRRLLDELDAEDQRTTADDLNRRLGELEQRQGFSRDELHAELDTWLEARLTRLEAEWDANEGAAETEPEPEPATEPPGEPRRRTRPGRRSGSVYNWTVDDESGKVVKLDIARVYDGPDEPERVELDDDEPADDDGDEANAA